MTRTFSWGIMAQSRVVNSEVSQKDVQEEVSPIWSVKGRKGLHNLEGCNNRHSWNLDKVKMVSMAEGGGGVLQH